MSDTENENHVWQDAHVGVGTPALSLRVTEDEKQRLEQLRQELRLTSKGQVVRAALDVLERFMVAGAALGAPTGEKNWRDAVDIARGGVARLQDNNVKRNALAAAEGADLGSPETGTPSGSVDDKQLELPEMPGQVVNNAA
jgi:hypothetical protein